MKIIGSLFHLPVQFFADAAVDGVNASPPANVDAEIRQIQQPQGLKSVQRLDPDIDL